MIKINNYLHEKGTDDLEKMILDDLNRDEKKISSMFFYDAKGSELFEEITTLPEYYLTRTEIQLLTQTARQLKDCFHDVDVIEFGSGDCTKISIFFEEISPSVRSTVRYIPFDVSRKAVQKSAEILSKKYPEMRIEGMVADFMTQLDIIPKDSKKIICFLGSTIGNFSFQKATWFLSKIQEIMHPEDVLLLGFDMIKQKEILEKAYNDSQKVTERFNKNILSSVNSLIGSDFQLEKFDHIAFYNEPLSRIEMHLRATEDMLICCPGLQTPLCIRKDETIHTENSYKFTRDNIHQLATNAGLDVQCIISDDRNWFSLVQLVQKN